MTSSDTMTPVAASFIGFVTPDHPLAWLLALYALVIGCYVRGLWQRRRAADLAPAAAFFIGLAGLWLFTQTGLDTLGRRLFYVHRLQHLVLHHLGPFFIALAAPSAVLVAGLPARLRSGLATCCLPRPLTGFYRVIQQPVIGGALFVGLLALWLTPAIHGWAMAHAFGYWTMNLSMVVEGLAFWWFMLDPRPPGASATTHALSTRVIVLWAIMPPQIAIGAFITLAAPGLYPGYAPMEAAYGISAGVDQQIGGLLTWIPPAMMSVVGTLIILRFGFAHFRQANPASDGRSRAGARRGVRDPAENATSGQ